LDVREPTSEEAPFSKRPLAMAREMRGDTLSRNEEAHKLEISYSGRLNSLAQRLALVYPNRGNLGLIRA